MGENGVDLAEHDGKTARWAFRRAAGAALLAVALASPGCSEATVSGPSAVGNNVPLTVETFSGTLPVGEFRFYSFTVPTAGITTLTLLSLTEAGVPSTAFVQLALGVPRGVDCAVIDARNATPGVVGQVVLTPDPGVYCARISDAGNLTAPVEFSMNVARPR